MTAETNDSSGFADNEVCDTAANAAVTATSLAGPLGPHHRELRHGRGAVMWGLGTRTACC